MISNLLSNAIRYGEAGSIVTATVQYMDTSVQLTVTNFGPEIPKDLQHRIFDRFFQANPARSDKGAGWGLGLAIVKSITDLHGGAVAVRSSSTGTTSFVVTFSNQAANMGTLDTAGDLATGMRTVSGGDSGPGEIGGALRGPAVSKFS